MDLLWLNQGISYRSGDRKATGAVVDPSLASEPGLID